MIDFIIFKAGSRYLALLLIALLSINLWSCKALTTKSSSAIVSTESEIMPVQLSASHEIDTVNDAKITNREISHTRPAPSEPVSQVTSIWPHIRRGFQLDSAMQQKSLQAELNWYDRHSEHIDRVLTRSEPFLFFILNEIEQKQMPTELALLPIVESAFQPFAYSHGRAAGLWQFIPATGRLFGLKQNWWYDGRRDIYASTRAALSYLDKLNKQFDGDWLLALAAYNSGAGTVRKAIRKNKRNHRPTDFWHLDLPKETRSYVPKLLALKEIINQPHLYNQQLNDIPYQAVLAEVDAGSQIDLALAAELAGISIKTLYRYNPGYNRWATAPNGPHKLIFPIEAAQRFNNNLKQYPPEKRVSWKRHRIAKGETLSHIAIDYNTTIDHLRKVNQLGTNSIRAGKYLLIPVASREHDEYILSAAQRRQSIQKQTSRKASQNHTVQEGESFWTISRKYNVGMHQLANWNGLAIRDTLRPGQKLVIRTKTGGNTQLSSNIPANTLRSISYTVRNGDSLSRIADRYKVSVNDLHRWNSINGKYLKPGQRLKVYIDVTEQSTEQG